MLIICDRYFNPGYNKNRLHHGRNRFLESAYFGYSFGIKGLAKLITSDEAGEAAFLNTPTKSLPGVFHTLELHTADGGRG